MFLLLEQPADPLIRSFAPSSGAVGSEIRIYGSGFAGLSGATVGGVALSGFAVISDSEVRGTIAAGTPTGRVVAGTATSATDFVVVVGGGYTDEQAQDAVGAALVAGQHSGLGFSYGTTQDGVNRIDAQLLLPSPGLFYWTGTALQPLAIGAGLAVSGGELVATGAGAGVTPADFDLVGWWDAAAATSFSYSSGTLVSEWRDKSSAANHLTQATAENQPNRNASQNSLATVTFDGTDFLSRPDNLGLASGAARTVFVVARSHSSDSYVCTWRSNPLVAAHQVGSYIYSDGLNAPNNAQISAPAGGDYYCAAFLSVAGQKIRFFYNGLELSVSQPGSVVGETGAGGFIMGARLDNGGFYHNGQIAELFVINGILSGTNIVRLSDYCAQKWAL